MINDEIFDIANQASLKITADKNVDIKHIFRLRDKGIWGTLISFSGGVFFCTIPFIKTADIASKIIGIAFGLLFLILSILALIRQFVDRLKITDTEVTFRYNLKRTTIPFSRSMKITMKTEIMHIGRVGTLGSDFIIVSHHLQDFNQEILILKFSMNYLHADKARTLGDGITRILNDKIQKVNSINKKTSY